MNPQPPTLSLRAILLKALILFVALNVLFAALTPLPALGRISLYNHVYPGRQRFPFGENPAAAYNLSLYNLDAMFASHEIAGAAKPADEYRVLLVGDSSVWGTLLRPAETLAGQLNALGLQTCGKRVRVFNLGYPTISVTKDLMILQEARSLGADLVIWPVTLEGLMRDKQLASPLAANNAARIRALIDTYHLPLDPRDPAFVDATFWQNTIVGQRRALADLIRLQAYGALWAATGVDQEYPDDYPAAQRDLDAKTDYHGLNGPDLPADALLLDVLDAGAQAAGVPVLVINEPMLISTGKNSDVRYNFFYPRWAYDQYRQQLAARAQGAAWQYLDLWNLVPEGEFTNSAIHLTPRGEGLLAARVADEIGNCKFPIAK